MLADSCTILEDPSMQKALAPE
ncbi:UNVERIFIED_CONTAM: DNA-binding protein, partial [Mycobacterium avium subsp. hominissuis]